MKPRLHNASILHGSPPEMRARAAFLLCSQRRRRQPAPRPPPYRRLARAQQCSRPRTKRPPHPENQSSSAFTGNSATPAPIPLQEGLDVRPPRHYGPATLNRDRRECKKPSQTTGKTFCQRSRLGWVGVRTKDFSVPDSSPAKRQCRMPGVGCGGAVGRRRKMLPRSCTAKRPVWGGWSLDHQVLDPVPQHLEGPGIP